MKPGRAWVSAPNAFPAEGNNLGISDATNHVCVLANHGDQPRYNVTAAAYNPGSIAADITVTLISGSRRTKTSVRVEPGSTKRIRAGLVETDPGFAGVIRLESSQPIVPGGEVELYHLGTRDILIGPQSIAPVVWFELTPQQVTQPPSGPAASRGTVSPTRGGP